MLERKYRIGLVVLWLALAQEPALLRGGEPPQEARRALADIVSECETRLRQLLPHIAPAVTAAPTEVTGQTTTTHARRPDANALLRDLEELSRLRQHQLNWSLRHPEGLSTQRLEEIQRPQTYSDRLQDLQLREELNRTRQWQNQLRDEQRRLDSQLRDEINRTRQWNQDLHRLQPPPSFGTPFRPGKF